MMHRTPRIAAASALAASIALTLGACGGSGDGDATPPPDPSPPPGQINSSNYLDAFWVGAFGVSRAADALMLIDNALTNTFRAGDVAQAYNCSGGGRLTLVRSGGTRTLAFDNCTIERVVYVSGSLASINAASLIQSGVTFLGSGDFSLSSLVYRTVGGDGVNQTVDGTLTFLRRSDQTVQLSGGLSVIRNARADTYASLLATFAPRDVIVAPTVNTGSFAATTPRFSVGPLTVSGNATGLSVVAPDMTRLRGLAGPLGSLSSVNYEITPPNGTAPTLTQTLATSDSQVQAAIARVLQ